ncbi:MAG: DUF1189 family protein [Candidatus Dojkabacteria bacterium]|nr:DUF1189 family protein [Candidatus Dojkabacteria bacterium]
MHFLKSLVLSIFSPAFYREAVAKGGKTAFGVFTLFIVLVSALSFAYFALTFGQTVYNLPDELGDIPAITLEDGVLTTDPLKPYVLTDAGQYYAIDATGSITEIPQGYATGILLTRTSVVVRSEEAYGDQEITYTDLLSQLSIESADGETLYIDRETVSNWLQRAGVGLIIVSPIFIFLGNFIGKLITVLVIGLLGSLVLSLAGQADALRKSMIISFYALIPVTYLAFAGSVLGKGLSLLDINFSIGTICCLIPLFLSLLKWGLFWWIGAYGVWKKE